MRDLFFVGYLVALLFIAFKRPFLFTLIYAYVDIVAPQRLSYFMLNSVPLSLSYSLWRCSATCWRTTRRTAAFPSGRQ